MSYTDLRDFNCEYETTDPDIGLRVRLEKLGGGTPGKAYAGTWRYIVTDADGKELGRGQDFNTGTARTHAEAAHEVLDFFETEE